MGPASSLPSGHALRDVLGVGAGFGCYSLFRALIARMGDAFFGSAPLLADIIRELLALMTVPLLATGIFLWFWSESPLRRCTSR